jgi:hypothetical protein
VEFTFTRKAQNYDFTTEGIRIISERREQELLSVDLSVEKDVDWKLELFRIVGMQRCEHIFRCHILCTKDVIFKKIKH